MTQDEKRGWISRKDDKPRYGQAVLLYTAKNELLRYRLGRWETGHGYCDDFGRSIHNVTHWMLLPVPPEVDDDLGS